MKVRHLTANMTEGAPRSGYRNFDFLSLQEVNPDRILDFFDEDHWNVFIATRDRHQAVVSRKSIFEVTSEGWTMFHKSGKGMGLPHIATPARGMPWQLGNLDTPWDDKGAFFSLWLINSWDPVNPDEFTGARKIIVEVKSLPKINRKLDRWENAGRIKLGGGDGNSLKWDGELNHLNQGVKRGLDRTWHDETRMRCLDTFAIPPVGVGGDMRHEGKGAILEIVAPRRVRA